MSDDATVSITDVFPEAEVVKASTLRVGDTVFDVWGGLESHTRRVRVCGR